MPLSFLRIVDALLFFLSAYQGWKYMLFIKKHGEIGNTVKINEFYNGQNLLFFHGSNIMKHDRSAQEAADK